MSTPQPDRAALWEDKFVIYLRLCSSLRGLFRVEGWTAVHLSTPRSWATATASTPSGNALHRNLARHREHTKAVWTTSPMPAEDLGDPPFTKELTCTLTRARVPAR